MQTALTVLYLIVSVALISAVLLQSGGQGGLTGAISGGSGGQALWGKKKSKEELLGKITAYLAAIFMIFSIIIAIFHV
ncbi:preprotein translocase subunit SecG [Candidatus Contubernalis alkaliaceticus]|uniref:preprotein translocase subunit SecG n=1 Tax=Candidatus Contubernalis alkaliaceticus TaxID=338645 RepID=UPI001F4C5297|nr:preprotein translocase subunit SecG [Candidatus Contubernalis alkalaceticus]UNC90795.1 preprotein translocase subunit SecG [Candidatus Contubernalis alkalaceticus]